MIWKRNSPRLDDVNEFGVDANIRVYGARGKKSILFFFLYIFLRETDNTHKIVEGEL